MIVVGLREIWATGRRSAERLGEAGRRVNEHLGIKVPGVSEVN